MRGFAQYVKVCENIHKEKWCHFIIPQKFGIVKLKFSHKTINFLIKLLLNYNLILMTIANIIDIINLYQ